MPVALAPGSNFSWYCLISFGSICEAVSFRTAFFNMIVNGYCLNIAALPALSKLLAIPGLQGSRGCLLVSNTNTRFDMVLSLLLSCNVCLAKVIGRYYLKNTVLPLVKLFNS